MFALREFSFGTANEGVLSVIIKKFNSIAFSILLFCSTWCINRRQASNLNLRYLSELIEDSYITVKTSQRK